MAVMAAWQPSSVLQHALSDVLQSYEPTDGSYPLSREEALDATGVVAPSPDRRCMEPSPDGQWSCSMVTGHIGRHHAYEMHKTNRPLRAVWPK